MVEQSSSSPQPRVAPARLSRWAGYGLALLAGACWSCLGLFFRVLERYDLPPELIALNRAGVAGLALLLFWLIRRPTVLRIRWRDWRYFVLYATTIASFFLIYIYAVKYGSVALAAVLLYTGPLWVVMFARWRWHEPLTPRTLLALGFAVAGCGLVALGGGPLRWSPLAVGLGLLSGFSYALYSILSHEGLQRGYAPPTIVMYAMLGGALCLLPFQHWDALQTVLATPATWPALGGVALVSTVLASLCYAAGQQRIGASAAGILATVEPVLAAFGAWLWLSETLTVWQIIGSACVLMAVLLLATRRPVQLRRPSTT